MTSLGVDVMVIGSVNIDTVLRVDHLPAAGETVLATAPVQRHLGGKGANQAVAAKRAAAEVVMVACVGNDDNAEFARNRVADERIAAIIAERHDTNTGTAMVSVDRDGENSIIVDAGANAFLSAEDVVSAIHDRRPRVTLTQLETPLDVARSTARAGGALKIINIAPFAAGIVDALSAFDVVVANRQEHESLVTATTSEQRNRIAQNCVVVVTDGEFGVDMHADGRTSHYDAVAVEEVIDTTGAGDTFCGYLAAEMALTGDVERSVVSAIHAAAIAVSRHGATTSIPYATELENTS